MGLIVSAISVLTSVSGIVFLKSVELSAFLCSGSGQVEVCLSTSSDQVLLLKVIDAKAKGVFFAVSFEGWFGQWSEELKNEDRSIL